MQRSLSIVFVVFVLLALPVFAAVKGEEVSYSGGGATMKGYLAYDDATKEKRPGVLVVHEWWGHNDYARARATMLAEMGYVALAVDMYGDGKNTTHPEDAGKFSSEVINNMENATARFQAAMKLLQENPHTDASRIAAIGYCFGGSVVLDMARQGLDLDAVASFHGGLKTKTPAKAGVVKAKVMAANGADDPFVPAAEIEAFKAEMDAAKVDYKFYNYPGAVHSFTNPGSTELGKKNNLPLVYNADADKKSWSELTALLKSVFKK